jgi:hypothetical protein
MPEQVTPRVWLKAFWGFDPENEGYLGFTREGDRDTFLEQVLPGDLVLIYGADAPETEAEDRRQALGFLEIEPLPIPDQQRMSAEALRRKVESGWVAFGLGLPRFAHAAAGRSASCVVGPSKNLP